MQLTGRLEKVTGSPSTVSEVWVQATGARARGTTVVTTEATRFPVAGGVFTINATPGKATLLLVHARETPMPQTTMVEPVPLMVADGMTEVAAAVAAATLAGSHTDDELAAAAARAATQFTKIAAAAEAVQETATVVDQARREATAAAKSADTNAKYVNSMLGDVAVLRQGARASANDAIAARDAAVQAKNEAAQQATTAAQQAATATQQSRLAGTARTAAETARDQAQRQAAAAAASAMEAAARPAFYAQNGTGMPAGAKAGDFVLDLTTGVLHQVAN